MKVEAIHRSRPEILPSKERPQLLIDVLTLTGHPGTGKTSTIKALSPLLHIPKSRIFQAGEEFRALMKEDVLDYAKRSVNLDRELDSRMTEFMRNSLNAKPVIAEGRLAAWIAKRLVSDQIAGQNSDPLRVVSALLKADPETKAQRVFGRDGKKNPDLTIEEVREKNVHRATMDLRQWRKAYPELAEIDPLDSDLLDQNGEKVYDLIIDTGHLKVPEVVGTIYAFLLENGYVATKDENTTLSPHGQIYPNP